MNDKRTKILADALSAMVVGDGDFKRGDQVAVIPDHAYQWDGVPIEHPDVQFGFVAWISDDGRVYCRYWQRITPSPVLEGSWCSTYVRRSSTIMLHESVDEKYVQREMLRT